MTNEASVQQRPATSDIDVFGLTDRGLVRKENADHFFIGSFHRTLRIHATSFPADDIGPQETESRGFLFLVADGVGSLRASAEGSAHALAVVTNHLLHASEICSNMALSDREAAITELKTAVSRAHEALRGFAERQGKGTAATTLTMYAAFWPLGFVVQVGDSRLYRLRGDKFERLTNDQTMAQMMLEAGVMTTAEAEASHLKHVLWSAVGSQEAVPEVLVTDLDLRDRTLLCSDGLTKHVSDDEIKEHMMRDQSSKDLCHALVNLALQRGGTDNVTVVSGRVRKT
ncbi:MAG: protein phosphatase 2C domain-containing protein [Gemmatimonadota bacterium]